MKKQLSLLMAGGLLALASCNNGTTPENGASQASIDSAVNARVEQIRMEMEAKNDSIINALAQWKADSIIAAMKGQTPKTAKPAAKPSHGHPVSHAGNTSATDVPAPTVGNGKPKVGDKNDANTIGTGKPKVGDKNESGTIGTGKPKVGGK